MNYIDFQIKLANYPLFSLTDMRKIFDDFSYRQLDRWEKKGYLKKIKRGYYYFASRSVDLNFLFYSGNKIYAPSYISLETALKYYGFIPEEIFQITSVGTKKTAAFETPIGNFNYKQIKPSLYWGYQLIDFETQKLLLAEPEKAILDYLYINSRLKTKNDFLGIRLNTDEFKSQVNISKFKIYLKSFNNKQLTKRANTFLQTIEDDIT